MATRLTSLICVALMTACGAAGPSETNVVPAAPTALAATPAPSPGLALTPANSVAQAFTWTKAPAAYPAGAEITVIEGDTSKVGPFTLRLRFPDGYAIAPHSHPFDEHVTVIQGTFVIGMGRSALRESAQEMPAGSIVIIPSRTEHYLFMKGVTIVQAHGIGPAALNYVNAADDPRAVPATSTPVTPSGPFIIP